MCNRPLVILALLLCSGCSKDVGSLGAGLEATARCTRSAAELRFEPKRIEVRAGGETVAQATTERRTIDFDTCARTPTQQGWFTPRPYARSNDSTTLTCRFRAGFFIHVHPVYSSQGGEDLPEGSAVYLVVGRKRKLVASATVESNPRRGTLQFLRDYCTSDVSTN
jgi:hypothetical protein